MNPSLILAVVGLTGVAVIGYIGRKRFGKIEYVAVAAMAAVVIAVSIAAYIRSGTH